MSKLTSIAIQSNEQIAPGAFILGFERKFEFIPGQVIGITHDISIEPRLYSIASGNLNSQVNILYTVKPYGSLTPDLSRLQPGDKILYTHPFGKFYCDEKPAVWIATGTGIAPFASMMFSGLSINKTLIYGNRHAEGLYFHQQLRKIMQSNYFPCTSRSGHEEMFYGRVSDFIIGKETLDTTIPYYLCGSAEMVVEMRDLLIKKGVPYENVIAEIFF